MEFAVVLPLLAILFFVIVELGGVFLNYVEIVSAARVGARAASVSAEAGSAAEKALAAAEGNVSRADEDELDVSLTSSQPWAKDGEVTVRVTYPFSVSVLGLEVHSGTMSAQSTARIQ